MHLFDLLPDAKLNNLDLDWPYDSSGNRDVTKGPVNWLGMLGERWMYSESSAKNFLIIQKVFVVQEFIQWFVHFQLQLQH
jgi:hypothetical protein